jgi:hypothetical protein
LPNQPVDPPPPRRSSRRILLPTVLVILAAFAWSGFWLFASRQAEAQFDGFVASQAKEGRSFTCDERQVGGFPFRLELRCREPRIAVRREDGSFTVAAKHLLAVAQVYQPTHLIAEADGPLLFTSGDGTQSVEAQWSKAEASLIFALSGPQRLSVVADGLVLSEVRSGSTQEIGRASRLEAHARIAEGRPAPGSYDIVARLDSVLSPIVDSVLGGTQPAKVEVQGTVTGLADLAPKPLDEQLRAWQSAGGRFEIALLEIDRGGMSAQAKGDIGLDEEGHPAGRLTVALAGVDQVSHALKQSGASPKFANILAVGLSLLGKPTNIDGKPAIEVPVKLAKGKATIGAFPAGETPRLF